MGMAALDFGFARWWRLEKEQPGREAASLNLFPRHDLFPRAVLFLSLRPPVWKASL